MPIENSKNPLDHLGIRREHIIAIQEALTHTNKKTSTKRATRLMELLTILKHHDTLRNTLLWDDA